ncbi:MAG: ABC transporter ATP-binding protein [Candidatus Bathyarchaeia archaeon]
MPLVKIENVSKRYGKITAVENANLTVMDKEYICIIGPSGCGKTTLIKCISGIIQPTEGTIYINDKVVNDVPINERGIGYVFQEIALFPHMDVFENVSYGPFVKGWKISEARSLVEEMLNMMALRERIRDRPNVLSGGAQQKTAIARALASGSRLLLLDEPLGSLDVKVRSVLRYELRKMVKDLELTAIHVTHDQEEAMAVGDRIVVMKAGRIVEVGTPLQLYLHPKNLFTANFVGEANFFEGRIEEEAKNGTKVVVDGCEIYSSEKKSFSETRVVAAIRPEFVIIENLTRRKHCWKGKIETEAFIGNVVRYEVRTENGKIVTVKLPFGFSTRNWRVGDHVELMFPPDSVLLYEYPQVGLEREISIE